MTAISHPKLPAFAAEAPVRSVGSVIVIVFPLAVIGFAFAPSQVLVIAAVAAFYGAANGVITIVRGMAVPEMVTRDAYGAVNGSVVAPMNIMTALAPSGRHSCGRQAEDRARSWQRSSSAH